MQPVILDTDVASLSHKDRLPDPLATRLIGRRPIITFITLGELAKWAEIRHWGTRSRQALADWISGLVVLPGNDAVAVSWGRLSAAATLRGRPRPVNEMWVAACCLTYDLPLATLNLKARAAHPRRRLARALRGYAAPARLACRGPGWLNRTT